MFKNRNLSSSAQSLKYPNKEAAFLEIQLASRGGLNIGGIRSQDLYRMEPFLGWVSINHSPFLSVLFVCKH